MYAASFTVLPKNPTESWCEDSGTTPPREVRPTVGLIPTMALRSAGLITDDDKHLHRPESGESSQRKTFNESYRLAANQPKTENLEDFESGIALRIESEDYVHRLAWSRTHSSSAQIGAIK